MARRRPKQQDTLRNEQVIRILRMIRELDRVGGCDLYELAQRYGTTTRTVRRDLEALEASGIPVVAEAGEGSKKRWRIDASAAGRLSNLVEASHFLALRLAMAEAQVLRRTESLFAVMEDLAARIEKALGKRGRDELSRLDRAFFSWEKFAWRHAPPDVLWPLISAISGRHPCLVTYRAPTSGNTIKEFRVLPLRLLVHNGALYLHAWQPKFKTVLLLNLQRLQKLVVLDEVEAHPAAYDPQRLETSAFGIFIGRTTARFVLHFDAFARPYIEERSWHPTERLEPQPDGTLILSFECTPSYEVTNWVASWREHVEVLEPASVRDEFRGYARWLTERYGARRA